MGDVMFRNIYKIYYFQEKIKILNITMLLWCGVDDDFYDYYQDYNPINISNNNCDVHFNLSVPANP